MAQSCQLHRHHHVDFSLRWGTVAAAKQHVVTQHMLLLYVVCCSSYRYLVYSPISQIKVLYWKSKSIRWLMSPLTQHWMMNSTHPLKITRCNEHIIYPMSPNTIQSIVCIHLMCCWSRNGRDRLSLFVLLEYRTSFGMQSVWWGKLGESSCLESISKKRSA